MSEEQRDYEDKAYGTGSAGPCAEIPMPGEHRASKSSFDNWRNRHTETMCKTCMYWVAKSSDNQPRQLGRCRRRAPTLNGWPATWSGDWCGDHKLDETKI